LILAGFFGMVFLVDTAALTAGALGADKPWVQSIAEKSIGEWMKACDAFLERDNKEFIQRQASEAELEQHLKDVNFMIRWSRYLEAWAGDPDFLTHHLVPEISGRVKKLELFKSIIHNPMTDAEADAILAQAFPNGPGAAKAA
jgi:hypothetical protein